MNAMRSFVVGVILVSIGCEYNGVSIASPVGQKAAPEKLKAAVGRWYDMSKGITELRLSKKGELVAGNLLWDETKEEFTSDSVVLDIREMSANLFLFATSENETFFFFIEQPDADSAEFYLPDPLAFRDTITSGSAIGEVVKKGNGHFHVRLEANDKLEALLSAMDFRKYFEKEPILRYKRAQNEK